MQEQAQTLKHSHLSLHIVVEDTTFGENSVIPNTSPLEQSL